MTGQWDIKTTGGLTFEEVANMAKKSVELLPDHLLHFTPPFTMGVSTDSYKCTLTAHRFNGLERRDHGQLPVSLLSAG